jgi:hypothetical protein
MSNFENLFGRSIPAKADGRSQQKPTVDPSKSRRLIPTATDVENKASVEGLKKDASEIGGESNAP